MKKIPSPAPEIQIIDSGAILSEDKTHRYSLWRVWNRYLPMCMFIGLNPSRADAVINDPTITRCIRFAHSWQRYGGIYFANLYSFRTPDPRVLKSAIYVGDDCREETDAELFQMVKKSSTIIACWGSWPFIEHRRKYVLNHILRHDQCYCFGKNRDGQPKHPLYLKATTQLVRYGN